MYRNICLIGLPHSGKTTLGKKLYQHLYKGFIDTDDVIRARYRTSLQDIIKEHGKNKYLEIEKDVICSLKVNNMVISTGGSVIYQPETMKHLKETLNSDVYHLFLSKKVFLERANLDERGIIMKPGQTMQELYNERIHLYDKYSNRTLSGCRTINLDVFKGETYLHRKIKNPTYQEYYNNRWWVVQPDNKIKHGIHDYYWNPT
jgi:shikimate kinase